MSFTKQVFLNEIVNMSSFETIQHISQEYFLISLLLIFFVPFIVEIILRLTVPQPNFWVVTGISWVVRIILITFTALGIIPYFFQ